MLIHGASFGGIRWATGVHVTQSQNIVPAAISNKEIQTGSVSHPDQVNNTTIPTRKTAILRPRSPRKERIADLYF